MKFVAIFHAMIVYEREKRIVYESCL